MLWIAVTPDKFELPIAVEDTQTKLALRLGINKNTLTANVHRRKHGRKSTCSQYLIYGVEDYEE